MMSEIYTERLHMRPFTMSDEAKFLDLKTHPENMAGTNVGALSIGQARDLLAAYIEHWAHSEIGMWALVHLASGDFVGECGFATRPGFGGLTLRYTLDRQWWGRGLAPESVIAALDFGHQHEELDEVSALAMDTNIRSWRILEQAGMHMAENDFSGISGFRRYVLSLNGQVRAG
jgi:[ribosomal protein S5]-alanine N-acetyltransferase